MAAGRLIKTVVGNMGALDGVAFAPQDVVIIGVATNNVGGSEEIQALITAKVYDAKKPGQGRDDTAASKDIWVSPDAVTYRA